MSEIVSCSYRQNSKYYISKINLLLNWLFDNPLNSAISTADNNPNFFPFFTEFFDLSKAVINLI